MDNKLFDFTREIVLQKFGSIESFAKAHGINNPAILQTIRARETNPLTKRRAPKSTVTEKKS